MYNDCKWGGNDPVTMPMQRGLFLKSWTLQFFHRLGRHFHRLGRQWMEDTVKKIVAPPPTRSLAATGDKKQTQLTSKLQRLSAQRGHLS